MGSQEEHRYNESLSFLISYVGYKNYINFFILVILSDQGNFSLKWFLNDSLYCNSFFLYT